MTDRPNHPPRLSRRDVIKSGGGVIAASQIAAPGVAGATAQRTPAAAEPIEPAGSRGDRHWPGACYWANRLQDWRRTGDWIECLRGETGMELRSVAVLTRSLGPGGEGVIEADVEMIGDAAADGMAGFLIGVGGGRLHPLAAALAQRGSGKGGGMLALIDAAGRPQFREHVNDQAPLAFAELRPSEASATPIDMRSGAVRLSLRLLPEGERMYTVALSVRQGSGAVSTAVLKGVPADMLVGGVSLVSSPPPQKAGARFRFARVATGGEKVARHGDRAIGPCIAAMHSLKDDVLKLSAHFVALGDDDSTRAELWVRPASGGSWSRAAVAEIGDGLAALFRVTGWKRDRDWAYQLRYALRGRPEPVYTGRIAQDPIDRGSPIVVAMLGCSLSTQFVLEAGIPRYDLPGQRRFGRYEPENFNFPHADINGNAAAHRPDLVFVSGDQYYEGNPTRPTLRTPEAKLDTLYRWHQWLLSFRDLIRDVPTIMLVDDHDVLQGNMWGNGGRPAPDADQNRGGFVRPDIAAMAYRMQCGHNPDPHEPAPADNGIPVFFGAFRYGGVSFAVIEDRKWKTSPVQGSDMDVHRAELLGERQERFLAEWKAMHPGSPKVMLTQSLWGCVQTDPEGAPLLDFDANGYPPLARRRAVTLAKDAGCVMLCGDQHLASLVRLGVDRFDDGPVQFAGPATGTSWQRWFEPSPPLQNRRGDDPNTGNFRDAFGNPIHVMAIANPQISFREYRKHRTGRSQDMQDRALKSEGYGILRIDRDSRRFVFECWKWNGGPSDPGGQYSGWPQTLSFDDV